MKNYVNKAMTFGKYVELIDRLLADRKTTGENQSDAMYGYALINRTRMSRLQKTIELSEPVIAAARLLERKMVWLIVTEGWCGDAAQNIPAIEKIASESGNIETRYLLRDENLELMDRFLTDGGRAIPKLIAIDTATFEVLGTWGSRPQPAQELFLELNHRGVEKPLIMENMQRWYNADKSASIQAEFAVLLKEWNTNSSLTASA